MPRTFLRNTTALAVSLGVALPHVVVAQPLPARDAAPLAQSRASDMPELAGMPGAGVVAPEPKQVSRSAPVLLAQAETSETASDAVPLPEAAATEGDEPEAADAAAEPAADASAEATGAAAAEPSDAPAEGAAEAQAAESPAAEPAGDTAAESGEPAAEAGVPDSDTQPDAMSAEPPVESAAEAEPAAEPEAGTAIAAEPEAAASGEPPAGTEAEAAAGAPAAEPEAEAAAEPAAAGQPEAASAEPAPAAPDEPQAGASPEAASEPAQGAELPAAAEAPSADDLARALSEQNEAEDSAAAEGTEPAGAAQDSATTATQADAAAAPDDAAASGDAASATAAGESADPASAAEAESADTAALPGEAELAEELSNAVEVPEAEAPVTDAAREAAAADTAPEAAALAESTEPVTRTEARELTEETSRSATEDFRTDLEGALRESGVAVVGGAAGQAAVAEGEAERNDEDDDDRSNLERALREGVLPALAGLAVGQLLSNNRRVELNTGDRVVVTRPDGSQQIIKDDNALLLRPGSTVQTEEYADGSTRTIVTREDGSQVVTIRDADLRVLRRTLVQPDGTATALIDETAAVAPVDVASLPPPARPVTVAPGQQLSEDALREALRRETQVDRTFTLGQIRNIPEVRALVAPVDIQAITFDTGSAAINPDQAQALSSLGRVIADSVRRNPSEIYMIEGHTDTVGADAMNLALSDRRAESVALALTEFFNVPPENMVVQGYGEQFLKVPQEGDIRANRRASVRRITDLLARN